MMQEGYISLAEAATLLKRSKRSIYKLVKSGKLPCAKNAQTLRVRFLRSDVETVLAERTAVVAAKKFIGSPSLNLNTINAPFADSKRDPDDTWHIVQDGPATSRKVEGPARPVEPALTPDQQNAAFIEEQAHAPVIWVGHQGFQGIDEHGVTAEVRALRYEESLKVTKRFKQVRGI
jgi:excisionase family DNA binding protein